MAYTLGAPKRIKDEESGIVFLVGSSWSTVRAIQQKTRDVLSRIIEAERMPESAERELAILAAQNEHEEAQQEWLGLIVGWDGVVDAEGEPVPFTAEVLRELDVSIVQDVLQRLNERGKQQAEARDRKNAG